MSVWMKTRRGMYRLYSCRESETVSSPSSLLIPVAFLLLLLLSLSLEVSPSCGSLLLLFLTWMVCLLLPLRRLLHTNTSRLRKSSEPSQSGRCMLASSQRERQCEISRQRKTDRHTEPEEGGR